MAASHNLVAFFEVRLAQLIANGHERVVALLADEYGAVQAFDAGVECMEANILERFLALDGVNLCAFRAARDDLVTFLALVTVARINEAIACALHTGHCLLFEAGLAHEIVANALDDFVLLPAEVSATLRAQARLRILSRNVFITLVTFSNRIALAAVRIALMAACLARQLLIHPLHGVEPEGRTALEALIRCTLVAVERRVFTAEALATSKAVAQVTLGALSCLAVRSVALGA